MSGVITFAVNERSRSAEDKRSARVQTAERERLEMQFAESATKEQRDAARQARRERLKPAIDMLDAVERVFASDTESSIADQLRPAIVGQIGQMDDEGWRKYKRETLKINPGLTAKLMGENIPRMATVPIPRLSDSLRQLLLDAWSLSQMTIEQKGHLLERMKAARDIIDSEIVRGDWP